MHRQSNKAQAGWMGETVNTFADIFSLHLWAAACSLLNEKYQQPQNSKHQVSPGERENPSKEGGAGQSTAVDRLGCPFICLWRRAEAHSQEKANGRTRKGSCWLGLSHLLSFILLFNVSFKKHRGKAFPRAVIQTLGKLGQS